jgi:hypothetical protein
MLNCGIIPGGVFITQTPVIEPITDLYYSIEAEQIFITTTKRCPICQNSVNFVVLPKIWSGYFNQNFYFIKFLYFPTGINLLWV